MKDAREFPAARYCFSHECRHVSGKQCEVAQADGVSSTELVISRVKLRSLHHLKSHVRQIYSMACGPFGNCESHGVMPYSALPEETVTLRAAPPAKTFGTCLQSADSG